MSGHTPGPWTFSRQIGPAGHCIAAQVWRPDGIWLCDINSECGESEASANAALIASAPDLKADNDRLRAVNAELLAALEELTETLSVFDPDGWDLTTARAAIAKARGDDNA